MMDDWWSGVSDMENALKKQRHREARVVMDWALVYNNDPYKEYDLTASPYDHTLACTSGCTAKKRCDFVDHDDEVE